MASPHHGASTFGTARWASEREIQAAGLLDDEGVVLGRFHQDYLRPGKTEGKRPVMAAFRQGGRIG